MEFHIEEQTN